MTTPTTRRQPPGWRLQCRHLGCVDGSQRGVAAATGDHATAEPEPAAVTLRGCVRQTNGDFTVADPPGTMLTKPGGINNRGDMFGYLNANGILLGAVRRGR